MKKFVFIIISITLLNGCKYFRGDKCNNTLSIVGVYENIYDNNAKNILIIKSDGTFEQEYKKGDTIKFNNGTWKFFENSCSLYLYDLKSFNDLSDWKRNLFRENGIYRLNNIMFLEDLRKEFDFYRIED